MPLPFPNVPNLPGVPQVPRLPGVVLQAIPSIANASMQQALWQSSQATVRWGIFDSSGTQVVTPDSVYDFDYHKTYDVSRYPVQSGSVSNPTGFANYNKVELPFETSVRMTKGGSQSARAAFIQQIESIAGTTALYTILTLEKAYQNCNVTRVEYARRGASGAYFFAEMNVYFIQIIQTTPQYTNTALPNTANAADPTAQGAVNQGTVTAGTPSASASSLATAAISVGAP